MSNSQQAIITKVRNEIHFLFANSNLIKCNGIKLFEIFHTYFTAGILLSTISENYSVYGRMYEMSVKKQKQSVKNQVET